MQNVRTEVQGSELIIRCDLDNPGTVSSSGKSRVIATTRGGQKVTTPAGDMSLNLNLYTSRR